MNVNIAMPKAIQHPEEITQHILMLFLHHLPHDFFQVLGRYDIGIAGAFGINDIPADKQVGNNLWPFGSTVFGLYMEQLTLVHDIMIKAGDHSSSVSSLGAYTSCLE